MSLWTRIIDLQNIMMAWKKVKENDSAPEVDGITTEEFEQGKDVIK